MTGHSSSLYEKTEYEKYNSIDQNKHYLVRIRLLFIIKQMAEQNEVEEI